MTIKTSRFVQNIATSFRVANFIVAEQSYEAMIAESQAKLAETTLVPGCTKIYA